MDSHDKVIQLQADLIALDQYYHGTYTTPEAINALRKTLKTFNITIQDWNTLIEYINTLGSTIEAIYVMFHSMAELVRDNSDVLPIVSDVTPAHPTEGRIWLDISTPEQNEALGFDFSTPDDEPLGFDNSTN